MRAVFLLLASCSTETSNPSGCPGHVPDAGDTCNATASCMYNSVVAGCTEFLPIFDCIDGTWSRRRGEFATCPADPPMPGVQCPMNVPCTTGNVRSLSCDYGCIKATCGVGSWVVRYCDAGTDARTDAPSDAPSDAPKD